MSRPQPEYVRLGRAGVKKTVPLGSGAMKADIRRVGLLKDHSALHRAPPWAATTATAFRTLLLVRVVSAMYSGIADCDESEWSGESGAWRAAARRQCRRRTAGCPSGASAQDEQQEIALLQCFTWLASL
jgi:hypothetical protein